MTSAFESVIQEAMAELEKQRDELVRLQQNLDQYTATARSKRRQVSATVDARGDLVELKFHGQSYRTMPANDLAKLVVETIQEARQNAQAQMFESLSETNPEGAEFGQAVVGANHDWAEALSGTMTLPQPLLDLLGNPPKGILGESDVSDFLQTLAHATGDGERRDATGTDQPAEGNTPPASED